MMIYRMSLLVLGRIASTISAKPPSSPFTNTIPTAFACSHLHPKQGHCVSQVSRCTLQTSTARAMSSSEGLSEIGDPNARNAGTSDADLPSWKERIDASIARSRKVRGSNYVQISTMDRERMEPRCRTVVLRGFLRSVPDRAVDGVMGRVGSSDGDAPGGDYGDCVLKMITDRRSNKVTELSQFHRTASDDDLRGNDTAEMVWWFPKSSEQYRIRGRLQFVGGEGPLHSLNDNDDADGETSRYLVSERKQQWGNLSDPAREQFYWENPGVPYTLASENGVPAGGRDEEGRVLPAPDTFLLMLLYPTKIDYLRLGDNFRQVDEWSDDGPSSVSSRWRSIRVNP